MKRMTLADLPRRYQDQIYAPTTPLAPPLRHPLPKQDAGVQPLGANQDEEGGVRRINVLIIREGMRLLDLDNLYGSVKFLADALRYKNLIPDDNPQAITLEVRQRKVPKKECGTIIEITYP